MASQRTVRVPHLGGVSVGYEMPERFDPGKPTLVLINSFVASSALYRAQIESKTLKAAANVVGIEPLGHGKTRTKRAHCTYWDVAQIILEAISKLGIMSKVFVVGESRGGWIATRMALLAPERIAGIIPVATTMDSESERLRKLGCWDANAELGPLINALASEKDAGPDFVPSQEFVDSEIDQGFGKYCPEDVKKSWGDAIKSYYQGDEGRRRLRVAAINLRDRDSLLGRLSDIRCPVLWFHGSADSVYTAAVAEEEIKLFSGSKEARLTIVEGGQHFLDATHQEGVNTAVSDFVQKHGNLAYITRLDR